MAKKKQIEQPKTLVEVFADEVIAPEEHIEVAVEAAEVKTMGPVAGLNHIIGNDSGAHQNLAAGTKRRAVVVPAGTSVFDPDNEEWIIFNNQTVVYLS